MANNDQKNVKEIPEKDWEEFLKEMEVDENTVKGWPKKSLEEALTASKFKDNIPAKSNVRVKWKGNKIILFPFYKSNFPEVLHSQKPIYQFIIDRPFGSAFAAITTFWFGYNFYLPRRHAKWPYTENQILWRKYFWPNAFNAAPTHFTPSPARTILIVGIAGWAMGTFVDYLKKLQQRK